MALLPLSAGAASDTPHLSSAQTAVVAKQIAKLKYAQERALASQWSDAKKVAEFICRPLATSVLKRQFRTADRVFLGTDDPRTLNLVSNRRLEGSGQVRTGDAWRTFTFSCTLDPRTGKAVSFTTKPTSSGRAAAQPTGDAPAPPRLNRYFGPGPVRSPTFNPLHWPGSKPQPLPREKGSSAGNAPTTR